MIMHLVFLFISLTHSGLEKTFASSKIMVAFSNFHNVSKKATSHDVRIIPSFTKKWDGDVHNHSTPLKTGSGMKTKEQFF